MIERATRDAKKTTNAAAVHGSPPRHPETSTTTAPIENSVSQNARNPAFACYFGAAGWPAVLRGGAPFRKRPMNSSSRLNAYK